MSAQNTTHYDPCAADGGEKLTDALCAFPEPDDRKADNCWDQDEQDRDQQASLFNRQGQKIGGEGKRNGNDHKPGNSMAFEDLDWYLL